MRQQGLAGLKGLSRLRVGGEKLVTNALTVASGSGFGGSRSGSANGTKPLTVEDARVLADPSAAPRIESVAPEVTTSQTALHEGTSHTVGQVVGTCPAYFKASNSKVAKGDCFSSDDVLASRKVAVIGSTTAADPVGRKMVLGGTPFTVVGVLSAKGGTGFQDPDGVVVAPLPIRGFAELYRMGAFVDALHDTRALDPTREVTLTGPGGVGLPGPAPVNGDEARLRQLVANLVGNAVTHTPADPRYVSGWAAQAATR